MRKKCKKRYVFCEPTHGKVSPKHATRVRYIIELVMSLLKKARKV